MRARAIRDLSQLADPEFFSEVTVGLALTLDNARRLQSSAELLAGAEQFHAARVLRLLSEEEASKVLILLDAVRCPRHPPKRFSVQLGRFNDHLAKGLYARACKLRPATLAQLQVYLDSYREAFYLDGPNSIDWIFRNEVASQREEAFYVDYVATDQGRSWLDPGRYEALSVLSGQESPSLRIATDLYQAGIGSAEALATVADFWRPLSIEPDMPWRRLRELNHNTLLRLDSRGLLRCSSTSQYERVVQEWQFPMFDLDLTLLDVDVESLRERQELWSPDW